MGDDETNSIVKEIIGKQFHFFNDIYVSEEEMFTYYLKFLKVFKNPERAYYEIFTISEFFRGMRRAETDVLKLIMITSLIEHLNSEKEFLTFPEWLTMTGQDTINSVKTTKRVFSEYGKEYGYSSKFRKFFQSFLSKKEKIEFVSSIKFFPKLNDGSFSKNLFPLLCFEETRCRPPPVQSCPLFNYDKPDCLMCNDEGELKKALDEFAEFLYTYRSEFVHNARIFALASSASFTHEGGATMSFGLWTHVNYNFRKLKKPKYEGGIMLDLNIKTLQKILENNFQRLLDNFIEIREDKLKEN